MRIANRAGWVLLGALAACNGSGAAPTVVARPTHVEPRSLWSYRPPGYFSPADFLAASAISRDLAVFPVPAGDPEADATGVIALDTATGAERWHKDEPGWLLHPPHATEPLYLAPAGPHRTIPRDARLERLDPRTGRVLATVSLQRAPGDDRDARVVWSAAAALVITGTTLTAFDWTTGAPRWHAQVADNAYQQALLVRGDRLYLANSTNQVISLVDGKQLAAIPGMCCTAVASPDGRHVFLRADTNASLELDPSLQVVQHTTGEVIAASNTYYAVNFFEAAPGPKPVRQVVRIFAYGQAKPVVTLAPDSEYSAIELSDHDVFYYRFADHAFLQQALPTGPVESIDPPASHTGWVTWGAELLTRPIIERPYAIAVYAYAVQAYLIGEE